MRSWLKTAKVRFKRSLASRRDELVRIVSILLISIITVWLCLFLSAGRSLDLLTVDAFFKWRGQRAVEPNVIIAALTNETYDALGVSPRYPFPRKLSAKVFERLSAANPKIIIADQSMAREDFDPEANKLLAEAISKGPVTIFSGVSPKKNVTTDDTALSREEHTDLIRNDPIFESAAKLSLDMWFLDESNDNSGKVYRIASSDSPFAKPSSKFPTKYALEKLAGYNLREPGGRDLINFYGAAGTIETIPWEKVVLGDESFVKEKFSNKVVITGYMSSRKDRDKLGKDEFHVPVGTMYGAEIHAVVAANLIESSWIRRLRPSQDLMLIMLLSFLIAAIGLILPFKGACFFVTAVVILTTSGCYFAFRDYLIWFPLVGVAGVAGALTVLANLVIMYFRAEKKNKINEEFWDFETEEG